MSCLNCRGPVFYGKRWTSHNRRRSLMMTGAMRNTARTRLRGPRTPSSEMIPVRFFKPRVPHMSRGRWTMRILALSSLISTSLRQRGAWPQFSTSLASLAIPLLPDRPTYHRRMAPFFILNQKHRLRLRTHLPSTVTHNYSIRLSFLAGRNSRRLYGRLVLPHLDRPLISFIRRTQHHPTARSHPP